MVKIEWAPLIVPARRRLQMITIGVFIANLFVFGVFSYLLCALILLWGHNCIKALVIVYAIWIYSDRNRAQYCIRGSGVRWMRDNYFFRYFRDYFPVELVKTAELPANRNYILACFPHGVLSFGLFTNMCADVRKWNELFPKVRVHLGTLAMHFNTPVWREVIQAWSMISVSKKSLLNNLTTSHDPKDPVNADGCTASAIGLIVGGAEEALEARPGKYILTVKKRKGFIKLAMQSGAAIVPSISFGEVDIYNQIDNPPGSLVRKMQIFVKNITGISPLLFNGRGFFQYSFGLLPHRRRIVQVVGAPLDVPQRDSPSAEEVDKVHMLFMENLAKLFETHKAQYLQNPEEAVLIIN